jgi:flagellar M-ring protein FliF
MTERLKQLLDLLPANVRALPPAKLFVLLGIFGAALAVGLVSLLWLSGGAKQQVLYTQLSMEDAAAITAKLKEMRVPYTIGGDGTTILVPSTVVYDTRLRLAAEGLPQGGGMGFELFDQRSFGMTEFMQKLNYQRALQGELARTIMQLAAVQRARVHIVLPEKSLFIEQQEKPTASVVLKLVPGRRLSPDQIRGIAHLVGSSVEGLEPDDVTIVDTNGNILSREEEATSFLSHTEAQLAYQKALEEYLERRVQSLLERAVGKGKVLVRVSAALDFQHIERTEERFDADNPAVRSEQRTKEEGGGPGFWAIGVPGVHSNVDTAAQEQEREKDKSSLTKQSETINYELSKMVSKVIAPSGEIKRLSVAVLVDGTYQPGKQEGERTYVPRTAEELAKYRNIVKSAVGYNEARGDRVEVANVPFESREDLDAMEMAQEAQRAFWLNLSRYGAYVVLGLLFFLFVGRPLVKWVTAGDRGVPVEAELPRTVQELEADMGVSGMLPEAEEGESPPERLKIGRPTGQELRTQLAEFVRSEPERAVEVLRVWLRG